MIKKDVSYIILEQVHCLQLHGLSLTVESFILIGSKKVTSHYVSMSKIHFDILEI